MNDKPKIMLTIINNSLRQKVVNRVSHTRRSQRLNIVLHEYLV